MLKEVMLGSGGIMLAAAIFASSVNTGSMPAATSETAPVAPPPVVEPTPVTPVAPSSPAPSPEDTGDTQFGAPMVSAHPVAEPMPLAALPESGSADGTRPHQARRMLNGYPVLE